MRQKLHGKSTRRRRGAAGRSPKVKWRRLPLLFSYSLFRSNLLTICVDRPPAAIQVLRAGGESGQFRGTEGQCCGATKQAPRRSGDGAGATAPTRLRHNELSFFQRDKKLAGDELAIARTAARRGGRGRCGLAAVALRRWGCLLSAYCACRDEIVK